MKLKEIYDIVVKQGMKNDPRPETQLKKELAEKKNNYRRLSNQEKKYFDLDSLFNPYSDSRILYGDGKRKIKRVLVGIDIGVGEILLADRLNSKNRNKKIDLCISHHPEGKAWANFYEVMDLQTDMYSSIGIPTNIAVSLLQERKKQVSRRVHASNHAQTVDAAKLLNMPLLCMHTPCDNQVHNFLENSIEKRKPKKVKDVINILNSIPEYQIAKKNNAGPKIISGDENKKAGKIVVEMTGGTEGPKKILDYYMKAGVGTIICMHLSEDHFKYVKNKPLNIIIAGHIASDNIGLNLLFDKIQKRGKLDILCCSGFNRVERRK